jgi:hypothetical protein
MSGRKSMGLTELNAVMKRCAENYRVRYVRPTIHPRARIVVAFDIYTDSDVVAKFTITNNPDENFDLNKAVNEYLDKLEGDE